MQAGDDDDSDMDMGSYGEEMKEEYEEELEEIASSDGSDAPMLVEGGSEGDSSSEEQNAGRKGKQSDSDSESSIEDDLDPEAAHSQRELELVSTYKT